MRIIFYVLLIWTVLFSQDRWKKLNGPEGGIINTIVSKGDTLIAGGRITIFYSVDRGEKWYQSNFKITDGILDFVFTDEGSVLAACQNWGIYKSDDFINWRRINQSGNFRNFGKDELGRIYSGTLDGKIYSSGDHGENWILEFITQGRVANFISSWGKIFAGGTSKILEKDTLWRIIPFDSINTFFQLFKDTSENLFAHTTASILISTDTGYTWQQQPSGTFFNGNFLYGATFNRRIIGAFTDETGWFGNGWGAAVSDDLGITWRWSQAGLPPKITGYKLAVSGTDTYLTTNAAGVFKSTDFGDSWFALNNGLNAATVLDIHFDNNGILFTASWSNGLSISTDQGGSWEMINNGVTNVNFYSIISDDGGTLYSGSERGAFRSTNKGENWQSITRPGNGFVFNLKKDKKDRIYALTYGSGIHRTTDKGETWQRIDHNFNSAYIFGFETDRQDNLYVGGRGGGAIYKSTDDGNTWDKVYEGIPEAVVASISISQNGDIFAAIINEGILKSTDGGLIWEKKNIGLPNTKVRPLNINNEGNIFTALYNEGIYKSVNNGESWIEITGNMSLTEVRKIVSYKNELYLATNESVWKSNPDSLTSVAEDDVKPKEYFLSQNYPNPFNPSTTIKYSLAEAGRVTLSIYDLLGREVINLIDEEKPAGEYETTWNASSYPSGVYFMRMQAGEFSETRKVVLMK
jgi:photosystem II stability/assembly factor-like uncharacterized protein